MKFLKVDKTASKGIVIGKVYLVQKTEFKVNTVSVTEDDVEKEIVRFEAAVTKVKEDLIPLAETNPIFGAHLEMVKDITLYDSITVKIKEDKYNAEYALETVTGEFIQMFESLEDEYMRERAADMKDIRDRLLSSLQGITSNPFEKIKEPVILVAEDLSPSDTAKLNLKYVLGFITRDGGVTSHVSIMAKGLGIPALVGATDILKEVKEDDTVILNAGSGEIIINPDSDTVNRYQNLKSEYDKRQMELTKQGHLPAVTKDGRKVSLCVNAGNVQDIKNALQYHIDGVGLFRSEFLYMENTHFPTEEEQFSVYKEAALLCSEELTIRTLDIGGDKSLSYYRFEKEENPFLGWRAIRISLELKDMFKDQLRAILRASAYGNIRIMFPMIISPEELRMAKEILKECQEELNNRNIPWNKQIEVGMMIETPASVILAEDFAKEVDFFSIGTNDLTQYILAVDRGNKKISRMYNSFHPSVIRSIARIIKAAHDNNIKAGMCGEFAGDEKAVLLLLGLGLDEFSMSAGEIPNIKNLLRNASYEEAVNLANNVCEKNTLNEIYEVLGIN
ncbi:phosphoenolpyruvate--protein phosphotransferase [Anaerocolumna sp. MB42-C2]|uniref:phosphoenolpyruvate--protein phosphotransferase n=1 Tax=Anaerocolumna sp. MB42-C2 TaxID=3070997 RepID=UPI0027E109E2|nr:phosphoenolpyruvate--protein phosphotransferase [Anaerocolumna sp. MB42-C2]WMJ86406.1 phosphoenolpyruvate--protein phosphotransferase [Anaerocolumna sp. MB42-C2]